jgi:phospholipid/cholesterol/gamma-HCH transport system ATP-binding protein
LVTGTRETDDGKILVGGKDITGWNEQKLVDVRHRIGMVFQESALFDSLTVRENVAYRAYEEGQDETEIEDKVRQTLGFVGLEDAIEKFPAELSGGMKRRVALARALISQPEIMLYDEPTAGLDPVTSRKINELIIALRDINNVTGIFVTHRMRDAFTLASEYATNGDGNVKFHHEDNFVCIANTRFLMLRDGKIIFEGPDEELRRSKTNTSSVFSLREDKPWLNVDHLHGPNCGSAYLSSAASRFWRWRYFSSPANPDSSRPSTH